MILFLSKYPETAQDFQDGFYQRVINIDTLFETRKRTYLEVKLFGNWIKKHKIYDEKRVQIECNMFLHLFAILKVFSSADLVYIQSIYNLLYTFPFLKSFKKKYVLDLHGVVPEELQLLGNSIKSKIFQMVEKFVYKDLDTVIGVSNRLTEHYKGKYPNAKTKYLVYSILPNNLQQITHVELADEGNSKIVNFVYSGNLQQWQNIDLMLEQIKKINDVPNYFFQILTGDPEGMMKKIVENNLNTKNIDVRAVKPHELFEYYKKAHYGFVLRDDIIINNVACPTKLVEYMNYGIIPIVLSDQIGDFYDMNYERLSITGLTESLPTRKSEINIQIIKKIYDNNLKNRVVIENMIE